MFLALTSISNEEFLVNANQIVSIHKKYDNNSRTVIVYNSAGMPQENYDVVLESYDVVKNYLLESANIFNK